MKGPFPFTDGGALFRLVFPASENGGHGAWATVAMKNSDGPHRLFIRRVGYEVVSDPLEPQRLAGEIRTAVARMRKWDKSANGGENFCDHAVSGVQVVGANELPDFIKVRTSFRMKLVAAHDRRAFSLFSRK